MFNLVNKLSISAACQTCFLFSCRDPKWCFNSDQRINAVCGMVYWILLWNIYYIFLLMLFMLFKTIFQPTFLKLSISSYFVGKWISHFGALITWFVKSTFIHITKATHTCKHTHTDICIYILLLISIFCAISCFGTFSRFVQEII